ncbi:MAG TPA: hypothetical protein VH107_01235 [Lacipirellulaceae bacterium]|nr:hypothetical protein [Lacipirellulaceae bacterium]
MRTRACFKDIWLLETAFVLSAILLQGCRETPTSVSGTVTLDGKPLAVASDARGTVLFQAIGGQGTVATGLLDPTGHFELAVGSSNEIPPGKYQVAVTVSELLPKAESAEQRAKLVTPAKYASVQQSGLQADVHSGENQLVFALTSDSQGTDAKSKAND